MSDEIAKTPAPADGRARGAGRAGPAAEMADRDEIASADRAAAAEERERLAHEPLMELEPDPAIEGMLLTSERLFAYRKQAVLDRRGAPRGASPGLRGDLYLTSIRLLFLGPVVLSYPLADLKEVALYDGGLRLLTHGGTGVRLEVERPQLLRVQVAAAWRTA